MGFVMMIWMMTHPFEPQREPVTKIATLLLFIAMTIYLALKIKNYQVWVKDGMLIVNNAFNIRKEYAIADITKMTPAGGKGLEMHFKKGRVTIYKYYKNYQVVWEDIAKEFKKNHEN